ncbi:MAG: hypothetical protein ACPGED_06695 [Flavobacteriales bacterium]
MENILDSESGKESNEFPTLQELADNGFKFDFGTYLNDGIEQWKQNWGLFAGYAFVSLILLVISAFTIIGFFIVALPLTVGYHYALMKQYKGETVEFNDLFGGFKKTGDLLVLLLLQFAVMLVPMILMGLMVIPAAIAGENMSEGAEIGFALSSFLIQMLFMVVAFAMQVLLYFSPTLITVGGLKGMPAFKASLKIAKKNFWWILGFSMVAGALAQLGSIACGIGVFFTLSFAEIMRMSAYKHIFGLHDRSNETLN